MCWAFSCNHSKLIRELIVPEVFYVHSYFIKLSTSFGIKVKIKKRERRYIFCVPKEIKNNNLRYMQTKHIVDCMHNSLKIIYKLYPSYCSYFIYGSQYKTSN